MKKQFTFLLLFAASILHGQADSSVIFGFRHLRLNYKGDNVDLLIKSEPGEEFVKKPVFLFCQGSLPIPLIVTYKRSDTTKIYNVFPFDQLDSLLKEFHLVIISKPGIPLQAQESTLNADLTYSNKSHSFPPTYKRLNNLSYYTYRNIAVLNYLRTKKYVSKTRLVVAGHSEGSTIAAKISSIYPYVTSLIYSGGNPLGRYMTILERVRSESSDSTNQIAPVILDWKNIVDHPSYNTGTGESHATTLGFSFPPPLQYLMNLKIPVLVTYGGKDYGLIQSTDYFHLETIRQKKSNFTFIEYPGLEHNFFSFKADKSIDYDNYNWNKVASDWYHWLNDH